MNYQHLRSSLGNVPKVDNGCHTIKGGAQAYFKNGLKHRMNGPAVIQRDGTREYFKEGLRHRSGGKPAIVKTNGIVEYWEDGVFIKKEKIDPNKAKLL